MVSDMREIEPFSSRSSAARDGRRHHRQDELGPRGFRNETERAGIDGGLHDVPVVALAHHDERQPA
jgi:hypothetical protein